MHGYVNVKLIKSFIYIYIYITMHGSQNVKSCLGVEEELCALCCT